MLVNLVMATAALAGTWQGPCETRGQMSVKFTYVFSEPDAAGAGTLGKTKLYYRDAACAVYSRTGRMTVRYTIGEPNAEGIAPIDVRQGPATYYDIFHVSDDGDTLTFGDQDARTPDARPTTLSTTDRVFVRVP